MKRWILAAVWIVGTMLLPATVSAQPRLLESTPKPQTPISIAPTPGSHICEPLEGPRSQNQLGRS